MAEPGLLREASGPRRGLRERLRDGWPPAVKMGNVLGSLAVWGLHDRDGVSARWFLLALAAPMAALIVLLLLRTRMRSLDAAASLVLPAGFVLTLAAVNPRLEGGTSTLLAGGAAFLLVFGAAAAAVLLLFAVGAVWRQGGRTRVSRWFLWPLLAVPAVVIAAVVVSVASGAGGDTPGLVVIGAAAAGTLLVIVLRYARPGPRA
ncbi:MAG TPA: hypothetical protein VFQ45_01980 [Longimicrobium sp.]|nr:hypothetical protein [Longimicrobium sp.]